MAVQHEYGGKRPLADVCLIALPMVSARSMAVTAAHQIRNAFGSHRRFLRFPAMRTIEVSVMRYMVEVPHISPRCHLERGIKHRKASGLNLRKITALLI